MDRHRRHLICLIVVTALSITAAGAEVPVGGQVLDADGQPLRGARVGLEPIPPAYGRVATRLGGDVGPDLVARAETGADGYFEIAAPRPGAFKVVVEAPGHVAMESALRPLYEAVELPAVELRRSSPLEIQVTDEEGAPADARVGLYDRREPRDGWRSRLRLARTGDDGLVRMPRDRDEELQIELLGPSRPRLVFELAELEESGDAVELKLAPGVLGTVHVSDGRGRRFAGAIAYQGGGILPFGQTDAEGRLEIALAPPAQEPPGVNFLTPDGYRGYFELRFSPEEENEEELTLEPLRRVRGTVVDSVSRDPVPGAIVWVHNGPVSETDARGRYELRLFPSSRLLVQATAEGYGLALEHKVLESPNSEDGPTVALPPAALVRGEVVDADGRRLAGVDVVATPAGNQARARYHPWTGGHPSTRTSKKGRFQISGLSPSTSYELRFKKPGFAPVREKVEGLEAFEERSGIRVVLDAGRTGIGWVVDETEAPVAGAEVRLEPVASGDPRMAFVRARRTGEVGEQDAVATDSEGRFRIRHLAPGRYNLEVKAPGFAPATVPGVRVATGAGEVDFGTVVLSPGADVEGVVLDPDGVPVADAEVRIGQGQMLFARSEPLTLSDPWGKFTVVDQRPGDQLVVMVSKSGFSSETVDAVADGETVEVVLRPAGRVTGQVRNRDGEPVAAASVSTQPADMSDMRRVRHRVNRPSQTDEQGRFELDEVEPGTVTLSVEARQYQRFEIQGLKVPAGGEVADLEIVLERGATVVGTVTRKDGTPVVGARVSFSPAATSPFLGTRRFISDQTDGEGRYRLTGVPPGAAMLTAQQGEHRQVTQGVEVRAGSQTVDLVFDDAFDVSGRVIDSQGNPVAGAALNLSPAEASFRQFFSRPQPMTSGVDGSFTLPDVAPGRYHVAATKDGYAQAKTEEPFEVLDGPVTGLELELRSGATLRGRILGLELDDLASVVVYAFNMTGSMQQGLVDYEGRYSVPSLGSGPWNVMARLESSGRQVNGQVEVAAGALEAELDLEFKTGFSLTGIVLSAGQPQSGRQVYVQGTETGMAGSQTSTGSDGRFRVAHLPAGRYRVMLVAGTSQPISKEVEVPTDEELLIEVGTVMISGYVRDEVGDEPMVGAGLQLEPLDVDSSNLFSGFRNMTMVETDSRGFFSLSAQEGRWRLIATKGGYAPAETTLQIVPGSTYDSIELRLSPTEGITFVALHDSGVPPTQVVAAVIDPSGRQVAYGIFPTAEGGAVRVSTVPPGTWELLVQSGESAVVRLPITAPGHAGQVLLSRAGTLRITVPELAEDTSLARIHLTGPDGRPHFMLERMGAQANEWPVWKGEAVVSKLAPGVWSFVVTHSDGRTWNGQAAVSPGATAEVSLP